MSENLLSGVVVRLHGHHAYVRTDQGEYLCPVRGRLKKGRRRERSPIAVGDRLRIAPLAGAQQPEASIEELLPRRTELYRADPHDPRVRQVLAANVDLLAVVAGADLLEAQLATVDRLLATAHLQRFEPLLIVNKCDLRPRAELEQALAPYHAMHLRVLYTCAARGELDGLPQVLAGKCAVFAGMSGVGKSSLLNVLDPALSLRVGDVDRDGEGRHTTTHVSLLPLSAGWLVDTPGVREFAFYDLKPNELSLLYPDFAAARERCRFSTCTHRNEPHCGVKAAVEAGQIDQGRYERYLGILRDCWNTEQKLAY